MDKYSQLKLFKIDNVGIKGNLILEQIFEKSKTFKNYELSKENLNYFNNRLRIIKRIGIYDMKDVANYMRDDILPVFVFNDFISKVDNNFKRSLFKLWLKNQNEHFALNEKTIKDVAILAKEIVDYNLENCYMFSLLENAFMGACRNNNIGGNYFNHFKDNKILLKQFLNLYITQYNQNDLHQRLIAHNLTNLIENILKENLLNELELKDLYIKIKKNDIKLFSENVEENFENHYQKIVLIEELSNEINDKNNKTKKRAI